MDTYTSVFNASHQHLIAVIIANCDPNRAISSEFARVLNKIHKDELEPTLIANDRLNLLVKELPIFEVNLFFPF